MKEKINLSKKDKNNIISLYNNGISIRKIEKKYPYSFTFIYNLIKSNEHNINLNKNYKNKNGYNIIAICKKTKKRINDYKNQSGSITSHLKKIYPNIELPTNFIRKSNEYKTGKFWYHDFFNFEYELIKKKKKCKYCNWETEDINNLSGSYEKHLLKNHNKTLNDYIKEFPNEKLYFKKEIYDSLIECKECNKYFKSITNTHLKTKHNITQYEYKLKHGETIISSKTKDKLNKNAIILNKTKKIKKTSKPENEIKNFLIEKNITLLQSKRSELNGKEIDLISLEKRIGIEFNGCKFHTENFGKKTKNYHLNKTLLANEKGYGLIHIFEDEWEYKKEIVKSRLLNIFNIKNKNNIYYARKCKIKYNINSKEKNIFFNQNHIQGTDKSIINIAAYYNDELVALMTFDNKRYLNKGKTHSNMTYELKRFCTKKNIIIIGIASKLLKNFIKKHKPNKIISFADRRWTLDKNNNLYTKLGFKLTNILKPDYYYFNQKYDRYKRFHKFNFGKSNIKKKFPNTYNMNKSEWEMMQELGFDRIWDCGKFKYEMNF